MTKKEPKFLAVTAEELTLLEELLLAHIKETHKVHREYLKYCEVADVSFETYREQVESNAEINRIANTLLFKVYNIRA